MSLAPNPESRRPASPDFSRILIDRQNQILGRSDTIRHHFDEQVIDSPGDSADESVIDTNAEYFLKLANKDQQELLAIRAALDRLQRGTYGVCESCENPIATERLKRVPTARYCIDCQTALERRTRNARLRILPKA